MSFVVSARKYRPTRFDEVVGQRHVSQTLKNALQTDHLAHAFLFCGPRGVGKTTSARILAKVLNCENRTEDFEPCNTCSSCVSFDGNANVYIRELDAASNNSVEHIRSLNEQARIPLDGDKFRVFIVDEVHMLSRAAFNAFLKTLEEPPRNTIFILATTEKHKIIPTILSRCQVFDFKRIQPKDVVEHLKGICAQEGIEAEEDALHIIGQKADGALRDALSIFDRVTSFTGKTITYEAVIENLNVLDYDYFFRATDFILSENRAGMMLLFDEVLRKGFDADLFLNGLAAHVRDLLVCKDAATIQLLEVGEKLRLRYHEQSALAPADLLLTVLNLANDCDQGYRLARNKRLHVEMTLLKMTAVRRAFRNEPVVVAAAGKPEAMTAPAGSASPSNTAAKEEASAEVEAKAGPGNEDDAQATVASAAPESTAAPAAAPPETSVNAAGAPGGQLARDDDDPTLDAPAASAPTYSALDPDALLAKAAAELKKSDNATALPPLTQESLEAAYQQFLQENAGTSVAMQLKMAKAGLEGDEVVVKAGSQRVLAMLRENDALLRHLRRTFKRPLLVMRHGVDESMQLKRAPVKRRLTPKDKFLAMRKKNPAIDDLRKRFDLRPEE